MFNYVLKKIVGTKNQRELRRMQPGVARINERESWAKSLEGKGVHVVTVNDYLAHRDAEWMGRIYRLLGLTTGCVVHGLTDKQRQREYGCDITYGQNNEFGFDYLRDNMKFRLQDYVQR